MRPPPDIAQLIAAARRGDKRALGRVISAVENDQGEATAILGAVYSQAHHAWVTGVTGAPGAGKSTIVDRLVTEWRSRGNRVAVLAVDPTSPFTGGALLGDRIRMQHVAGDDGVLVRSMATRGWLGGIARSTTKVATLCAGLGFDEIVIETVGVGQSEVDVAAAADTTMVVVTPGWGDAVQVAKAGLMEIGDVFAVNKADRAGTEATVAELVEMLNLDDGELWRPPVVATVATSGQGIDDLVEAVAGHRLTLADDPEELATRRRERDFIRAVSDRIATRSESLLSGELGRRLRDQVVSGEIDPWAAAASIIE